MSIGIGEKCSPWTVTRVCSWSRQTISGSTGCSDLYAPYSVDLGAVTVGPVGTTKVACPDEVYAAQERAYLAALQTELDQVIARIPRLYHEGILAEVERLFEPVIGQ